MKKDPFSGTRLILFYSDDVIDKINHMRSQFGNYVPNREGTSCLFEFD